MEPSLVLCKQGVAGSIPATSTKFPCNLRIIHRERRCRPYGFTSVLRLAKGSDPFPNTVEGGRAPQVLVPDVLRAPARRTFPAEGYLAAKG
jgi:hypothetical protein